MPDAKPKGKGISKKLGPLPYWGWGAVGVGTYLVYRYLRARSAANAGIAASGTTGGTLIPNDIGLPAATAIGAGTFSSQAGWEQAALTFLTGNGQSPGDALNGINQWLQGNCVSEAAYNAISQALVSTSVGLPPGYTTLPTLSVCPAPQQTPTPSNPSPAPAAPSLALPLLNAQSFAKQVLFGQYAPGDYTQVGQYVNGVYTGANVGGGAPVYLNAFGGFVQDFNPQTANGGVYVPTSLLEYVQGHTPAGVTVPTAT